MNRHTDKILRDISELSDEATTSQLETLTHLRML